MSRETELIVDVINPDGTKFQPDTVTYSQDGNAQVVKSRPFKFKLTATGTGILEVKTKGHHTYSFSLKIKETGTDLMAGFDSKSMLDAPRMVTLFNAGSVGPGAPPGKNFMSVVIGKPREFILVTGFDYPHEGLPGGMQFHLLGTKRMHDLRDGGTLDDSTVITWFDCKSGFRTRWVMGRGSEVVGTPPDFWKSGWCRMTVDGDPPTIFVPGKPLYPGLNVNGIPEIYQHIEDIGKSRPSSLEELSLMTHSWYGGPLLFDTDEALAFQKGGAKEKLRDPDDRDGRFWKDFRQENMPNRKDFANAFSPSPFIRVWGCLATTRSLNILQKATNAQNDTQTLGVKKEDRTSWVDGKTVFADNRPGLIDFIQDSLLVANYMFFLATAINKKVEGGAPGMGALFTPTGKYGFNMFVARENVQSNQGPIIGFKKIMEFMEKNLGSTFSKDGYLTYNP